MRSRVTAKRWPTSSSVCSPSSPMPNRRRRISFSLGESVDSARSTCVVRSWLRSDSLGERAVDGLADPPGRVRRELAAAAVLEPVDGLHEPDVAFLDEVEQRQVAAQVALGHRDDQSKIRLHQLALGLAHGSVAPLDLLEE